MNKNILFSLLIIFSSVMAMNAVHTIDTALNPKNVIILWDIHDVIVKRNGWKTTQAVLGYSKKYQVVSHMSWPLIKSMMHNIETSESLIEMAREHRNPQLEILVRKVSNMVDPIEGMAEVITELKALGCTHHIGSNIGATVFADLCEKMPHIFKDNFDLACSQVASYKRDEILKKPNEKFFEEYKRKNKIDLTKTTVIFIDDKLENVKAAQRVGMIGIHFKNQEQLRICLNYLCSLYVRNYMRLGDWIKIGCVRYSKYVFFPAGFVQPKIECPLR
jgi:FMN phosphatase YigB (HAD superfamily)